MRDACWLYVWPLNPDGELLVMCMIESRLGVENIERILDVDRRLASIAITDAQAAGADQEKLIYAMNQLNQGDADVLAGKFAESIAD